MNIAIGVPNQIFGGLSLCPIGIDAYGGSWQKYAVIAQADIFRVRKVLTTWKTAPKTCVIHVYLMSKKYVKVSTGEHVDFTCEAH
jgi:hypothetical protein